MIQMDILDYGIYCEGKHIADFDDLDLAKGSASAIAEIKEADTIIVNNFTGEIVGEFVIKFRKEVVEVEP